MHAFAVIHKQDEASRKTAEQVIQGLEKQGMRYSEEHPELVITVGGDGTFLYAIQQYLSCLEKVCFLGIHSGTLGFLTDYQSSEAEECIQDIVTKEPRFHNSALLRVEVNREDSADIYFAFNEMRVENIARTQLLDVYLNEEYLETFRGTGICVSTQAGSTAYNRSLGSAVIQEGLHLLEMSEITGIHHREFKSLGVPLILREDTKITLTSKSFSEASLCYDYMNVPLDKETKSVECRISDKFVRFVHYRPYSYMDRLKNLF